MGAYLIFRPLGAGLVQGGRLIESLRYYFWGKIII